ncbi:MAG: carbohydrate ABC transporter substrate-binding protein [Oscillospiraceae bacterium]|nr:carbohydrate ABC transporter substrate-binding protein [Oscillospiraceae bacterium]
MKKFLALMLTLVMLLSVCSAMAVAESALPTFDQIVLGENTDLTAKIHFVYHRTDIPDKLDGYVKEFQKTYPNIEIEYELITDYAENSLLRVGNTDWTIMGIPTVEKDELPNYFVPLGDLATLENQYNFMSSWSVNGVCYGIPSTAAAQGVLYNKAVFEAAGITELPKTPDEFIAALQAVKEKTSAIPLYTNYAAGWTMGAWDAYIGVAATGKASYMNQDLLHAENPFADRGDGTGPYAVYKILYDAVANGLIEEDYTTTDWEGCKGMMNRGEIATMVLGSWAYTQMQQAGDKPEDIGYMAFPITVDGKQYAPAGGDYNFGINVQASDDEKLASMYYLKWLTHESGFSFSEGGLPINKDGEYPELYAAFEGIDMVADDPALEGEETLLNELNSESELALNAGGNTKVQAIVEHAFNGDESFDDIMNEWNEAWSEAQESLGVEIK